jgi:hypothetical protein
MRHKRSNQQARLARTTHWDFGQVHQHHVI